MRSTDLITFDVEIFSNETSPINLLSSELLVLDDDTANLPDAAFYRLEAVKRTNN